MVKQMLKKMRKEHKLTQEDVAKILGLVWAIGFATVLAWKIAVHLLFRREVLTDAYPVADRDILDLWEREMRLIERKKPIPLLYSTRITSPMTVGKSHRAIRTLLPERTYSAQELQMIFRHELRHVQRLDVDTKMFYAFCEAMCWFNPLVWIAMRKAAADLELSCDEMVLHGKDEQERRRYAELLLDSAGDDRAAPDDGIGFVFQQQVHAHQLDAVAAGHGDHAAVIGHGAGVGAESLGDGGTGDVGIQNTNLISFSLQKNSKHRGNERFTNAALAADNTDNLFYVTEFVLCKTHILLLFFAVAV